MGYGLMVFPIGFLLSVVEAAERYHEEIGEGASQLGTVGVHVNSV